MECAATSRSVSKQFTLRSSREGAGFVIRRSIGSSSVTTKETDPFLMLDELPVTNYRPGEFPGAPWHPHVRRAQFCATLCTFVSDRVHPRSAAWTP